MRLLQAGRFLSLGLAALLAVPVLAFAWTGPVTDFGFSNEPSSSWDAPASRTMWPTAPASAVDRVYFAGYLQLVGTSGALRPIAYLGFWRDCNADGFIGSARLGSATYSAVAGYNPAICPVGTPYNDGVTITEFRAVGPGGDVPNPGAKVWVDWGTPADAPWVAPKAWVDTQLTFTAPSGPWVGLTITPRPFHSPPVPTSATFYAHVGTTAGVVDGSSAACGSAFPNGCASFVYGAPPCSVIGPGAAMASGWFCDPTWWAGPTTVGDLYELRDVDCDPLGAPC